MNVFKIITPLSFVNLFAVFLILYGSTSKDNLAPLGIIFGLLVLITGLIFDLIFRKWCKKDTLRLWVFELIFIGVMAVVFQAIVISNRD